jgi:hypothetical protein
MSAATRRPYLGEDVHHYFLGRCYAAKIIGVDPLELYVFFRPHPQYLDGIRYDPQHGDETWHYQH